MSENENNNENLEFADVQNFIESVFAAVEDTAKGLGADTETLSKINLARGSVLSALDVIVQDGFVDTADS